MAKIDEELRAHLGKQLRRVFRYSPVKKAAKELFKQCGICGKKGEMEIDHIDPVAPVDHEIGSLEYFKRMFCLEDNGEVSFYNLIGLCKKHHKAKSKKEMGQRAFHQTGPYSAASKAKRKERYRIKLGKKKHVSARRKKSKAR